MKISFTGDIIFSGSFANRESREECIDNTIVRFLSDSDVCVCDIEGPIFSGKTRNDRVAHKNSPEITEFTSRIAGSVWYIGNNHILDYDFAGLKETIDVARESNIRLLGAGENLERASAPLFFGEICGVIGVRYHNMHGRASASEAGCFIWDEKELIKERIKQIKEKCKWCIIVAHGGDEFCDMPLPTVRNRYLEYLDWGADIIVGHHPHVVQNYEYVEEKLIIYSLGNFLFGTNFESIHAAANIGVLVKIDIDEQGFSWSFLPVRIDHEQATVVETQSPAIFRNIDADMYSELAPVAAREYLCRTEIKNIMYNLNRKDIKFLGKARIVFSHLKKNIKMRRRYKSLLKAADCQKQLSSLLSSMS